MDGVVLLAWRGYPATALMVLGLVLTLRALQRCHAAWRRPLTGLMQPLAWVRGFRLAMIGLALVGIGAAWLWQLGWLLAMALAIGGEETLEASIVIAALRAGTGPSPAVGAGANHVPAGATGRP
jgi:hypothetical protein